MTKAELLSELESKFYKLGNVAPVKLSPTDTAIREAEGVKWYSAGLYEKSLDGRMIRKNVSFYVENEGEVGEAAFYVERLPIDSMSVKPEAVFKDLVIAKIENKISDGTILKGIIESIDENTKLSVVKAYQMVIDEVIVKKYFVYADTTDKLQFKAMKDTV
jgi:hypothetical protein